MNVGGGGRWRINGVWRMARRRVAQRRIVSTLRDTLAVITHAAARMALTISRVARARVARLPRMRA